MKGLVPRPRRRAGSLAVLLAAALVLGVHGTARASDSDSGNAAAWPARPDTIDRVSRCRHFARRAGADYRQTSFDRPRAQRCRRQSDRRFRQDRQRSGGAFVPDGYTLLFSSNTLATMAALHGPRAVDPLTALFPVGMIAAQPLLIVAHPSFAGSGFADVVRAAKNAPGALPYSTSGIGTLAHLTALWAQSRAGISMLHIPYSGSQSFKDVMTGEIPIGFTFLASALPQVRSGQLKAIAVTSRARSSIAPEIASLHESGLTDFESLNWMGVLAPAGTPPEVIARLSAEIVRMLGDPEVDSQLRANGYTPMNGTPAQFADVLRQETVRWAAIVKAADLRTE